MDFRILGPTEAFADGKQLPLGGQRQRALLAYLLLHPNETIRAERLLDELWHEPPGGGPAVLHTQVARLRRLVRDRIVTVGPRYLPPREPGELDLQRVRGRVAE